MTTSQLLFKRFLLIFLILIAPLSAFASEPSVGYQMALLDARAQNPQKVLLQQKITPADSTVREFEWILETLRNRCRNPPNTIVTTLVASWRTAQRNGYKVTLLQISRQTADFSHIAYQSMRTQKLDIEKIALKVLKDKYPTK